MVLSKQDLPQESLIEVENDKLGSLEVGKSPGINLLSCEKLSFSNAVKIRKIV